MKRSKGNHFKDDIRRTFIIYAFIPIFIITVASYVMGVILWNKTIVHKIDINQQHMMTKIETTLVAIEEETNTLLQRETFYKTLYDPAEKIKVYHHIYQFTNKLDEKVDFYIIDNNMEILVASRAKELSFIPKNPEVSWGITKRMAQNPYDTIYECHNNFQDGVKNTSLIIGKAIQEKGEVQGYILFTIEGDAFIKSVGLSEAQVVVTDKFNNIWLETVPLYSTNLGKIKSELVAKNGYIQVGNERYYIKSKTILEGALSVYSMSSIGSIITIFIYIGTILVAVLTILTIAICIVANKIVVQKTMMIDGIVEAFAKVEEGNLETELEIAEYEEFQVIGKAYNHMLKSIHILVERNEEIARQTVLAEIEQLESQFNPHFLFNTLEHIRYMAKMEPDAAGKMIISLSNILRYSINSNIRYVTIAEDLAYTKNYLLIQKYRFSNRFHYVIDMPKEISQCKIPKLIIQPVIENAVKYGFGEKEMLEVRIKVLIRSENLIIIIYDDGIGMSKDKLKQVQDILLGLGQGTHIGLYNVHRRIKLMYGDKYGLEVRSEEGHGTVVKMVLPSGIPKGEINDQSDCS